ncbi:hypothetical protein O3P69_000693 [Scylla paramamosain]|uniref:Uncharacterized protein n=1 Tax=Scylla paramamosain TaxID=85552 RepID=A0AAW0UTA0_SCYPA
MYWIRSLVHINSTCIMAEKMALILLDYLFIKDMLATSNLSSTSWWKEQQLNPLMMFGISPSIGRHLTSPVCKDLTVTEDIAFNFDSLQDSNLDLSDVKMRG